MQKTPEKLDDKMEKEYEIFNVGTAIWADPSLANEKLGWKATHTTEETLASAWAWEKHLAGK